MIFSKETGFLNAFLNLTCSSVAHECGTELIDPATMTCDNFDVCIDEDENGNCVEYEQEVCAVGVPHCMRKYDYDNSGTIKTNNCAAAYKTDHPLCQRGAPYSRLPYRILC